MNESDNPINVPTQEALAQLGRELLAGNHMFTADIVQQLLGADKLQLRALGYYLAVDEGNRLEGKPTLEVLTACVDFLADSFRSNLTSDDFALSQWDCAHELERLFATAWKFDKNGFQALFEEIGRTIGDLWLNGSADEREVILLGACEHLFANSDWKKFFDRWQTDAKMRPLYDEASDLAGKWNEMEARSVDSEA